MELSILADYIDRSIAVLPKVCKQRLWPWILILDTWNFEHLLMYQQYKQYKHNSSLSWFKKRVKTEQALTTTTSTTDRAQQVQIP
jgi:hypothetical protein